MSKDIAQLEAKVRWYKRLAASLAVLLSVVLCIAAADKVVNQALPGTFTIIGKDGKAEVITLGQDGNVKIAGDLTVVGNLTVKKAEVRHAELAMQVNELRMKLDKLEAAVKKGSLKVDSFRVIFHSKDVAANDALKPAWPQDGGWTTYMLPPEDNPGYTHPTRFGKRVMAAWWTPMRGLYDYLFHCEERSRKIA